MHLAIETMLYAVSNSITNERHVVYQILISCNIKLQDLYIILLVAISCSGGNIMVDTHSQATVPS